MGFGVFRAIESRPGTVAAADPQEVPGPMGPAAATQTAGAQGGAPMLAEINALKERVQKDPKDVEAWTRLANMYQDAGMIEPAVEFYTRAIALKQNDAALMTDLAICYQRLNQFDKSLDLLEKAQVADPSNWQSLYNIVVVAGLQMGRLDRAHAALAQLEKIRPDAPNLAQLKEALDKAR